MPTDRVSGVPDGGENLSEKQEKAIEALLVNVTLKGAASVAGVTEKTLRTWLRLPHFSAEYRQRRRESVEQTIAVSQGFLAKAMATLARNLTCGNKAAENRAAIAIQEMALKGVDFADTQLRIEELERLARARRRA